MTAFVVVDLGFGDAGKGLLTDFLVRRTGARVVVRYNGGAQAGHNVVAPDGRHHSFSQLGAGSFVDDVRTFLSRYMVLHPAAVLREADVLAAKGVAEPLARLWISRRARVVTPYHQAVGRLRELARGPARHGSCGVGIGETVADALAHPDEAIRAADLMEPAALRAKLSRIRRRMRAFASELQPALSASSAAGDELEILSREDVGRAWTEATQRLAGAARICDDSILAAWMANGESAVFEGAQGVLLDQWYGFHPYTTWSDATPTGASELLSEAAPGVRVVRLGVTRSHVVRHGPGPLPTETKALAAAVDDHNRTGAWQGPVRYGWFDAVLTRYALEVAGPLDALAVTHLDVPPRMPAWYLATGYRLPEDLAHRDLAAVESAGRLAHRIQPPRTQDVERQQHLGRLLAAARPVLRRCQPAGEAVLSHIEELLGRPVDLVGRGRTAAAVEVRPYRSSASPLRDLLA